MLSAQCRCRYTSFSYINTRERADGTDRYGLHSLAIKTSSVSVWKKGFIYIFMWVINLSDGLDGAINKNIRYDIQF